MPLIPIGPSLACIVLSSACLAQTMNWVQVNTKNSPSARYAQGMAYDIVRGRTVLFGGYNRVSNFADTWEYDGKDWAPMKPIHSPPSRRHVRMVYHLARLRTVMFGGRNNSGALNDTWLWDGKDWTQMTPKNSPSARWNPGMAYDSGRGRTVIFGGFNGSSSLGDTWEWDGNNWTQINTANSPSPRRGSGMVYDSGRKRIVLFGGSPLTNDTWEYDGNNWTQITTKSQPPGRGALLMAYDTVRKRIVLFGGWNVQSTYYDDTWEYDGKDWTLMTPATKPPARTGIDGMVYDQKRNRMVIFGGWRGGNTCYADTWEYVAQTLAGSPSTISIATGGTHTFSLYAGTTNASRLYWIFGSVTGTSPGVTLASSVGSVNIPLNPDFYTDITIGLANTPLLTKTRGTLDAAGKGSASFNVPKITDQAAIGVKFYHAYLVYDANSNFYMASNPVTLKLVQ